MPQLLAVAVNSRYKEPDLDYDWYVKIGNFNLFSKINNIYKKLLRDRQGDAPRIVCVVDKQYKRIGLLIAEIKSNRQDYVGRVIRNTIYFEIDAEYKKEIMNNVSALLLMKFNEGKYEKNIDPVLKYAEKLLNSKDNVEKLDELLREDIILPKYDEFKFNSFKFSNKIRQIALRSTPLNRQRLSHHLIENIAKQKYIKSSFLLVSTARVNMEHIIKFADDIYDSELFENNQFLIILSLSESVSEKKEVKLRGIKKIIELETKDVPIIKKINTSGKIKNFLGGSILLLLFIFSFWFLNQDKSNLIKDSDLPSEKAEIAKADKPDQKLNNGISSNYRDCSSWLSQYFKSLKGISNYQHFRIEKENPSIIIVKERKDSEEISIELAKKKFPFSKNTPPKKFPKQLLPAGLSLKRQWYLYDQIRSHIPYENDKNLTCPRPQILKSEIED